MPKTCAILLLACLFGFLDAGKKKKNKNKEDKDRITLKIHDQDKFLGVGSDDKLRLGTFEEAVSLKFNTKENIADKSIEGKDNKVLQQNGFWFFPKSFKFEPKSDSSSQSFRIVYYGPNQYILMKDDWCLGFNENKKFKRAYCTKESAAIFNMCQGRFCDSYVDIRNDLNCIKNILQIQAGGRNGNGYYDDDDEEDDDSESSHDRHGRGRNDMQDPLSDCLGSGRNRNSRGSGRRRHRRRRPDYDDESDDLFGYPRSRHGRRRGRNSFDIPGILGGSHLNGMFQPAYGDDMLGSRLGSQGTAFGGSNAGGYPGNCNIQLLRQLLRRPGNNPGLRQLGC